MSKAGLYLNKIRYTIYTPIYDLMVKPVFRKQREISIRNLGIEENSKVLIVGAGTGLDFEYLKDKKIELHAGDITSSMVKTMHSKAKKMQLNAHISIMDGQNLEYENDYFDYIILHLILAVIPDPIQCIKEVERVAKKEARISVFDKFIQPGAKVSTIRKMLNFLTAFLFSDITRDIDQIISQTRLNKVKDNPAAFGGNFRIIELQK